MNSINIELIKKAIEKDQWKKDSYVFACNAMVPYGYYQSLRKAELIEKFYSLVPTHFSTIKNFATFRGLNFYEMTVSESVYSL